MAGGRPTDYRTEFCEEALRACEGGATDLEVARILGINVATLYRWKAKHPEFCEALKTGKEVADERVERSLYHKAVGYSHKAVKIFMPAGATAPVYAKYTEHVPPDTTAAIFWLKNRRAEKWRDKTEVHHSHQVENMSDHDLERIAATGGDRAVKAPVDPQKLN